jgi:hypothetical protein
MKERPILFSGPMVRAILEGRKTQTRRVMKMKRLVQPRKMVRGDAPFASHYCADPRWIYDAEINQHGAVSAKVATGDDDQLGLKPGEFDFICPYADGETVLVSGEGWRVIPAAGQRLWIRESLRRDDTNEWHYCADDLVVTVPSRNKEAVSALRVWAHHKEGDSCPSIHMPRFASRITLEVTKVRVERLQNCSETDAIAEGGAQKELLHPPDGFDPDNVNPPGAFGYVSGLHPFPEGKIHPTAAQAFAERWDHINAARGFGWEKNPWVWVIEFKRVQP